MSQANDLLLSRIDDRGDAGHIAYLTVNNPSRRNALLAALPPHAQKLVTTTHLLWTDASFQPDAVWKVSNGSLEPVTSP